MVGAGYAAVKAAHADRLLVVRWGQSEGDGERIPNLDGDSALATGNKFGGLDGLKSGLIQHRVGRTHNRGLGHVALLIHDERDEHAALESSLFRKRRVDHPLLEALEPANQLRRALDDREHFRCLRAQFAFRVGDRTGRCRP